MRCRFGCRPAAVNFFAGPVLFHDDPALAKPGTADIAILAVNLQRVGSLFLVETDRDVAFPTVLEAGKNRGAGFHRPVRMDLPRKPAKHPLDTAAGAYQEP